MQTRKVWAIIITMCCCVIKAHSQNGGQTWLQDDNFQKTISVYDQNGKAFVNTYNDIEGSPFFLEEWKYCNLVLADNRKFNNVPLKLNLQNQTVHYLNANNVEMEIQRGLIKELVIIDTVKKSRMEYRFQTGFPPVNNAQETSFYEVLSAGKITMLKLITKRITQDKNELTGDVKNRFITDEDYYYYLNNALQRVKKDKSVLDLLPDKKDKVTEFVNAHKIGFKSMDDIKKIIDYYNSHY